jgi:hypothetical protein
MMEAPETSVSGVFVCGGLIIWWPDWRRILAVRRLASNPQKLKVLHLRAQVGRS